MSQTLHAIPPVWLETIGVIGFALYVFNYLLLTLEYLTSQSKTYFAVNLIAASCVLIGLIQSFNLASALIQGFWILISCGAIAVRLRPNKDALAA